MTRRLAPSPRRPRARRGEGERLREEILAAAGQLLLERGDEAAVSVRLIADAVGVTPPSIYLHFADKDALITAVCAERFREFGAALEAAAAGYDDPLASLVARGRAYVRFGLEHPDEYRILFLTRHDRLMDADAMTAAVQDGDADPEAEPGIAAFLRLVQEIARCQEAGQLGPGDPVTFAVLAWSSLHGLVSLLVNEPRFPWPPLDELVDRLLLMQLAGLGAAPAAVQAILDGRESARTRRPQPRH